MAIPDIATFNTLGKLMIQKYERYLPTAFDESMTLLEKMNKIIEYLNETGRLVNGVIEEWTKVMEWVLNEGLTETVIERLDEMVADGTFDTIINEQLLNSKATIVTSTDEPENPDKTFYWFKQSSTIEISPEEPPQSSNDGIYVGDNEPTDGSKIWYDII
jgi:hypothetical protein